MYRKIGFYTEELMKETVAKSTSLAAVCRELDLRVAGGNILKIKNLITEYNIDTSHFLGQGSNKNKVVSKTPITKSIIKKRLIEVRGHKCESCSYSEWNRIPIALELEHIDGNNKNNEEINLLLLCPNCHALTSTWKRKKSSLKV